MGVIRNIMLQNIMLGIPPLEGIDQCRIVRAVFLPEAPPGGLEIEGEAPLLVTAKEVIRVLS